MRIIEVMNIENIYHINIKENNKAIYGVLISILITPKIPRIPNTPIIDRKYKTMALAHLYFLHRRPFGTNFVAKVNCSYVDELQ